MRVAKFAPPMSACIRKRDVSYRHGESCRRAECVDSRRIADGYHTRSVTDAMRPSTVTVMTAAADPLMLLALSVAEHAPALSVVVNTAVALVVQLPEGTAIMASLGDDRGVP